MAESRRGNDVIDCDASCDEDDLENASEDDARDDEDCAQLAKDCGTVEWQNTGEHAVVKSRDKVEDEEW